MDEDRLDAARCGSEPRAVGLATALSTADCSPLVRDASDDDAELADILKEARNLPDLSRILEHLPTLRSIASELSLDHVSVDMETDPEIENHHQFVFHVLMRGSPRDAADRLQQWYRRTTPLLGDDCDKVHLSISLRDDDPS